MGTQTIQRTIGNNNNNNDFDSSAVVADADGSLLERLEFLQAAVQGSAGLATFPASAIPANNVSLAEVIREMYDQMDKTAVKAAAVMTNGLTLFTITGGPIEILDLHSVCVTANDGTASTLQYSCDGTDGAATTISAASASLASAAAGAMVSLVGTALSTAALLTANGGALAQTRSIIVPAGIITAVVGVGSTTGTWSHHLRYRPLARGVVVA